MTDVLEVAGEPGDEAIAELARRLREADKRELLEVSGVGPRAGLRSSVVASEDVRGFYLDGRLIGAAGLHALPLLGVGVPWFLGAPEVSRRPVELVRTSKRLVSEWLGRVERLENVVAASHEESVRYLQHLGFIVEEARGNPAGFAVRRFYKERANV